MLKEHSEGKEDDMGLAIWFLVLMFIILPACCFVDDSCNQKIKQLPKDDWEGRKKYEQRSDRIYTIGGMWLGFGLPLCLCVEVAAGDDPAIGIPAAFLLALFLLRAE